MYQLLLFVGSDKAESYKNKIPNTKIQGKDYADYFATEAEAVQSQTFTAGQNNSEKQELQTLNDRLAVIIDTVRRLEQDNEKLRVS